MDAHEISTGLWNWVAYHDDWGANVGSVYCESVDCVVLVDPLAPVDEAERFWRALDRDVERVGGPVHVLLTVSWHVRSRSAVVERSGARTWAPVRARAPIERRAVTVTDPFRAGDALPGGIEAFSTARASEVVYWLPQHGTLVPGDVILGSKGGGLGLCPRSWLPSSTTREDLAESLRPLLDLPVERVLVSHGEPVLEDGRAALAAALDEP